MRSPTETTASDRMAIGEAERLLRLLAHNGETDENGFGKVLTTPAMRSNAAAAADALATLLNRVYESYTVI